MVESGLMLGASRRLNFPELRNARDLGGLPTVDGGETRWRSLLRSDDLAQLTGDGVRALADYGIETVLDLRWPEEARASPVRCRRRCRGCATSAYRC